MKYRRFGRLEWQVSVLGFGAMRLPLKAKDASPADIDEETAIGMMRYAFDHGVNYVDTAYPYHGGRSEVVVGRALQGGYRQKVRVATKMPTWQVQTRADCDRFLAEQLERLQTERIDFYLLHGLNGERWPKLKGLKVLDWAEQAMADGRIGYLGFSFHDTFPVFKGIIDDYNGWSFCQVQYNFMDTDYQAGTQGVEYAAGKGLAVVVMEPLRGGRLSQNPPPAVMECWQSARVKRSPAEWALLWVWEHPGVSLALSGMSTLEQVVENVASADRAGPGTLTPEDMRVIERVRQAYRALVPVDCTACGYCMPCPHGVEIPRIFRIYNEAVMYNDPRAGRFQYRGPNGLREEQRADRCQECGECVEVCPQGINVPEMLKKAHQLLGPAPETAGERPAQA